MNNLLRGLFFCLQTSDIVPFLFCAKSIAVSTPSEINKTKPQKHVPCDWLLPPVFRFVVPSRISCEEMRKTCCFSVCIRSRQTPSFRQTPGPMPWRCVLCMDQSEGPTQPGLDDSCVTIGLRGHHRGGGFYLSSVLMFQLYIYFFLMCPALHFFYSSPKTFHSLLTCCFSMV